MLGPDTFLLNPRNRDFIEGRAPKPVGNNSVPGCLLLFMVPFLLTGVFTLALALSAWLSVIGYAMASRPAEATVTDKGISPDDEGDDDPYVVYRYSAAAADGGGRFTNRAYVSWGDYETFEAEDTLQVEYIAFSPGRSRVAGTSKELTEAGFMTFFTIFWNLITLPMTYFIVRSRMKAGRLQRAGQLVRGSLTGYETSTDSDNDLWVKIDYSFHTPTGELIRGEDKSMHNELKGRPEPPLGTPVAVLFADEQTHTVL